MKDYTQFTVEDFVLDSSFTQWTLGQSAEAATFWQSWLEQHPAATPTVRSAQRLLLAVEEKPFLDISDEAVRNDIQAVLARLHEQEVPVRALPQNQWLYNGLRVAAALVVLLGLGWLLQQGLLSNPTAASTPAPELSWRTTDRRQQVTLPDGSVVTLLPDSRFSYSDSSTGERVAHLTGEAFFNVAHDSKHPFLIFTGRALTKVLGTSFWIKANAPTKAVVVDVVTGKVSVYGKKAGNPAAPSASLSADSLEGVILTPNQRATYLAETGQLKTSLVESPLRIAGAAEKIKLLFNDASVAEIAAQLSKAYGIEIIPANEDIEQATFTGDLTDISLFEKLDLICKSTHSEYQIMGTRILITR